MILQTLKNAILSIGLLKRRRRTRRLPPPDELQAVMKRLGDPWVMNAYKYFSVGWQAELTWRKRKFRLVSERTYIDVYELEAGKWKQILPPDDQRLKITVKQICALLAGAVD
jgi:hypothetical protein